MAIEKPPSTHIIRPRKRFTCFMLLQKTKNESFNIDEELANFKNMSVSGNKKEEE